MRVERRSVRRVRDPLAILLAVLWSVCAPAGAEESRAEQTQRLLWEYGDTSGEWSGADGAYSVPLPDGRTAWLFSDTFYGPVEEDGTRSASTLIRNSIVVQDADGRFSDTLVGETPYRVESLVEPEDGATWYWMGDGTVERTPDGDKLRVFVLQFASVPPPFTQIADNVATFSLPDLELEGVTRLPLGMSPALGATLVGWGAAILETPAYTYVYGLEDLRAEKHLHLARAPANGLLGPWEYWTGEGWSVNPLESTRLLDGISNEFSVHPTPNGYTLVAQDHGIGEDVIACGAPAPEGPWGRCRTIYTTTEGRHGWFTYNAKAHPQLSSERSLTVGYNVNIAAPTLAPHYEDVTIYRPRFVEVPLPADL